MEETTKASDGNTLKKNEISGASDTSPENDAQAKEAEAVADAETVGIVPQKDHTSEGNIESENADQDASNMGGSGDIPEREHNPDVHEEPSSDEVLDQDDAEAKATSGSFIDERASGTEGYLTVPWMVSYLGPDWVAELKQSEFNEDEQYIVFTGMQGTLKLYPNPKGVQGTLLDRLQKLRLIRRRS